MPNNQDRSKVVRKWTKENSWVAFDFKSSDVILSDGSLFSIQVDKKEKTCRLWFGSVEEAIRQLERIQILLKSIGVKTNITLKEKSNPSLKRKKS